MIKLVTPKMRVKRIFDIPLEKLWNSGITTLLFDLDNTIVEHNSMDVPSDIIEWFARAKDIGFIMAILSNNDHDRVVGVADKLEIYYIARAKKPSRKGIYMAIDRLSVKRNTIALIGDQLFTDMICGNRAGVYTILVSPISNKEFWGTKISRMGERILFKFLKL